MKRVLVFGSTCVDVIIRIDHLPKTEENLHPESQRFAIGGCAYNVANILGRAGAPLTFVTPVGRQGVFGPFVKEALDQLGFVSPVDLPDAQNGCCYCFVEKTGERTFCSIHGAEYTFDPAWMELYADQAFDYGYICGLEVEERTGEALVSYLETANIGTLVYAPGPRGVRVRSELTERLFNLHPMLHVNASEALALSGEKTVDAALHTLHGYTGNAVVITLGAQGACFIDQTGKPGYAPGVPCEQVVDTIGAGDAHIGAILLGLSRGETLADAVALANRVSSAVVATDGATLSDEDFQNLKL